MGNRAIKEVIEVEEDSLSSLVAALASLQQVEGWVNLTPGIPTEAANEDRSLFSWLAGSATPRAPLATWMPPIPGSEGRGQLGILHPRGRLRREGIAGLVSIPSSWRCRQDHARRGLVFDVPVVPSLELAEIMVAAVEELALTPTTGRYLAEVFRRSGAASA